MTGAMKNANADAIRMSHTGLGIPELIAIDAINE